jgi:hypothetical protein
LVTKVYEVADLVFDPDEEPEADPPVVANGCNFFFNFAQANPPATQKQANDTPEGQLIQLITHIVRPQTWDCMGGEGAIEFFPMGMCLVVNQRQDVQEQIADLLEKLRGARARAAEVYMASLPGAVPSFVPPPPGWVPEACPPYPPPPPPFPRSVAELLPPVRGGTYAVPTVATAPCPMPTPALMPCTATEPAKPATSGWSVRAVTENARTKLEMRNHDEVIKATCECLALRNGKDHINISTANQQMRIHGPCFRATADSLKGSGETGWTLSGHVVFEYEKDGVSAQVRGDQVTVGLKDGRLEIGPTARVAPEPVQRTNLDQVLNSFWFSAVR